MPPSRRAKQFSMFDALKGLREALAAREKQPEDRRELAADAIEELNRTLTELEPGRTVTVVYYCEYEKAHLQLTGPVTGLDRYWRTLYVDGKGIDFNEIVELLVMDGERASF